MGREARFSALRAVLPEPDCPFASQLSSTGGNGGYYAARKKKKLGLKGKAADGADERKRTSVRRQTLKNLPLVLSTQEGEGDRPGIVDTMR